MDRAIFLKFLFVLIVGILIIGISVYGAVGGKKNEESIEEMFKTEEEKSDEEFSIDDYFFEEMEIKNNENNTVSYIRHFFIGV